VLEISNMKNASLQYDLRRVNFNPSINARLLWLAGLIATFVFVLWPNAGPAYAAYYSNNGETTPTGWFANSGVNGAVGWFSPLTDIATLAPEIDASRGAGTNWIYCIGYGGVGNNTDTITSDGGKWYQYSGGWTELNLVSETIVSGIDCITFDSSQIPAAYAVGFDKVGSKTFGETTTPTELWFSLEHAGAPANSISIDFPPNATSTPDFSLWSVSGNASSTGDTIQILSQATSSNTWIIDGGRYLGDPGLFSDFVIVKNTAAVPDIYRAYAILYHGLDIEASSSIITYTITGQNPGTGGYYGDFGYYPDTYPTSTASSTEWVLTCDPNDPFWHRSFCQIAKWILDGIAAIFKFFFMPKSSDFDQFSNLKTALENKPPMGYFYAIKDALTFNSTTTKAFDLASSTVAMTGPIFDPVKTGLTFTLWLLFAFWLFNRIKHFNL
jgi:hypothetical protein